MDFKQYQVYVMQDRLIDSGIHYNTIEQLRLDFPASDGWFIADPADLPVDFSAESYTISDGKLVKASAEVIASREAAATKAYNEQQRAAREAEYRAMTDPLVIEQIAEATPEIKVLKETIRAKYPYRS